MRIRVLQIVTYMGRGGLETLLMNCLRNIDREQVQFDFLVHRGFRADYDDEIEALGGRIYRLPRLNPFSPAYHKALRDFFRQHPEYRIVHCHLDCMSAIPLKAAKACGIPVRIAHAHSRDQDRDWKYLLKRHFMKQIPRYATHLFACSRAAGEWMFPGQNVTVIKNGIETEKFAFDPAVRAQVRQELDMEKALVVGHVGRFVPVKNHSFLVDVFAQLRKWKPQAKLLLVGEGELDNQIRNKIKSLGLEESVVFLGTRGDVNRIMQAMDVFVLPSRNEGVALASVEAQTSGAYCVLSDTVSEECRVLDQVELVSLNAEPEIWAQRIIAGAAVQRVGHAEQIKAAGNDIRTTAKWLQQFYTNLW